MEGDTRDQLRTQPRQAREIDANGLGRRVPTPRRPICGPCNRHLLVICRPPFHYFVALPEVPPAWIEGRARWVVLKRRREQIEPRLDVRRGILADLLSSGSGS